MFPPLALIRVYCLKIPFRHFCYLFLVLKPRKKKEEIYTKDFVYRSLQVQEFKVNIRIVKYSHALYKPLVCGTRRVPGIYILNRKLIHHVS